MERPGKKSKAAQGRAPTARQSSFKSWAIRIKDSDREAFAELFSSVSAKLVRYAQNFTLDYQSAQDVLQDVFVKLWDIRDRLDPDASLQSLLYTMTRNTALNTTRKAKALVFAGLEGEEKFELVRIDSAPAQDAVFDAANLASHMQRWIDELPGRRKEAFVLSRHHDLSHKEISDIMGLSERTVNTHIFLALKHLRAQLDALKNNE